VGAAAPEPDPLAAAEAALPRHRVAELTANGLSREDAVAALSHAGGSVAGAIEFHLACLAQVGGWGGVRGRPAGPPGSAERACVLPSRTC
jgi:hypothetical protein